MNRAMSVVLTAIGRMEEAGRVHAPRVTVETSPEWETFRRKLGPADLIGVLVEELAALYGTPWDEVEIYGLEDPDSPAKTLRGVGEIVADSIGDDEAETLLSNARRDAKAGADTIDFLHDAAELMGLPGRFGVADKVRLRGREWFLDKPGSCGRYGWGAVSRDNDLSFKENVVIEADEPEERLLAGLTLVEADATDGNILHSDEVATFRERRGAPEAELSP